MIVVGLNRVEGVGDLFHAQVSIVILKHIIESKCKPAAVLMPQPVALVGCGALQHCPLFMIRTSLVPRLLCCASLFWMERAAHHWEQHEAPETGN